MPQTFFFSIFIKFSSLYSIDLYASAPLDNDYGIKNVKDPCLPPKQIEINF